MNPTQCYQQGTSPIPNGNRGCIVNARGSIHAAVEAIWCICAVQVSHNSLLLLDPEHLLRLGGSNRVIAVVLWRVCVMIQVNMCRIVLRFRRLYVGSCHDSGGCVADCVVFPMDMWRVVL